MRVADTAPNAPNSKGAVGSEGPALAQDDDAAAIIQGAASDTATVLEDANAGHTLSLPPSRTTYFILEISYGAYSLGVGMGSLESVRKRRYLILSLVSCFPWGG